MNAYVRGMRNGLCESQEEPTVYLARFSSDVLPANRQKAIDFIRREVAAAREKGLTAKLLVPITRGHSGAALQFELELTNRAYQKFCVKDRFHLIRLFDAESIAEHDGELRHSGGPFALGILPTIAHTAQDQIQQFGRCLVGREVSAAANRGAQCAVEALDRIGGVNDPPHLWREGEERDYLIPLSAP